MSGNPGAFSSAAEITSRDQNASKLQSGASFRSERNRVRWRWAIARRLPLIALSFVRRHFNREATMKASLLLAGALVIGCAAPAMADEYYVVQGPSRHCTITTTRPADREVVTQIGPMAFTSRVEAEDRIKQTKVCEEEGTVGSSSTTIIKEK
jgi:hypothetical protein